MGRALITAGLVLLAAGLLVTYGGPFGFGRLPGDINIKTERYAFHFPLVTCLILSAGLSGILWLVRKFWG